MSDEHEVCCPRNMNSEIVSVSRLKEIRRGTVRGHVTGTVSKAILYDSADKIELVLFGEIPVKPGALYEVRVEEMVLGDCVPVRSPHQIVLLSDPGPSKSAWDDKNVDLDYDGPSSKRRLRSSNASFMRECVFYVKEKSNKIKQTRFFVNTLLCSQLNSLHGYQDEVSEVYIHNLKAEWFLYLIPGNFYLMMFESGFNFQKGLSNSIIDLKDIYGDVSISHLPESSDKFPVSGTQKIMDHKLFSRDHKKLMTFAEMGGLKGLFSFVNVEAEVLGISSFEKSGFITFVDSDSNMKNIAFTPARRVLPKFLIPGSRVVLYQLFMKSVQNGAKHFLSVTHMTQIFLECLPSPILSISQITPLNDIRTLQKSGVINIIVSIDCILSLSINTFSNIHCRLSVRDTSDTATLHIRDNTVLVRELFGITEEDEDLLRNVRNLEHGKIDGSEGGRILRIFSRLLQSGRRFYIKGDVRLDSVQFLVQTQFGKLPKCPRIHVFPYMLKTLSPIEELKALGR